MFRTKPVLFRKIHPYLGQMHYYWGQLGKEILTETPNGSKLETYILDILYIFHYSCILFFSSYLLTVCKNALFTCFHLHPRKYAEIKIEWMHEYPFVRLCMNNERCIKNNNNVCFEQQGYIFSKKKSYSSPSPSFQNDTFIRPSRCCVHSGGKYIFSKGEYHF